MNCPTRDPEPTGNPTFNQSPPAYERSLVPRSSPVCGGGGLRDDEYNIGLHIMALFVILAQSTLACAFPIITKRFPRLRIPPSFLFFARHFGTGVLISTAFVHLLPTAFISLTDPCLPPLWNKEYPAMAGAIAMAAVFLVTTVEMVFTRGLCKGNYSPKDHRDAILESGLNARKEKDRGVMRDDNGGATAGERGREGEREEEDDEGEEGEEGEEIMGREMAEDPQVSRESLAVSENIGGRGGMGHLGFGMAGRRRSRSHSLGRGLQKFSSNMAATRACSGDAIAAVDESSSDTIASKYSVLMVPMGHFAPPTPATSGIQLTPQQIHKKAMLQVFLLEMGILFHSVFIGMALSVTVGSGFVVLLIAVIFHQTFEGLALGSRIAALKWKPGSWQPWFMALAYGLTTPVGQAIGLGTHSLYSPSSETGLLMVGIMNAISSGLLVFAGLVELLAEDFLSDESWHTLKGRQRIYACFWVFGGAFGMALVGAWA